MRPYLDMIGKQYLIKFVTKIEKDRFIISLSFFLYSTWGLVAATVPLHAH